MKIYQFECTADQIRHWVRIVVDTYERGLHQHGSHQTSVEAVQEIAVKAIDRIAVEFDSSGMDEFEPDYVSRESNETDKTKH